MKSILIGNGVNINFGNENNYTLRAISEKLKQNLKKRKYETPIFEHSLSDDAILMLLDNLVTYTNRAIKGNVSHLISSKEEEKSLSQIRQNHSRNISDMSEIGFEDWLFIIKLILKSKSQNQNINFDENEFVLICEGLKRCILDCIYNDGKIEKLYLHMPVKFKNHLLSFDNIFTINYDNNIDSLTNKPIYHLHGDFKDPAKPQPKIMAKGFEHCFCNAIMDYSGFRKCLRISLDEKTRICYDALSAIDGELVILGMSPDNDSHIFNNILENSKITKVLYYYVEDKHKKLFEEIFASKKHETKNVFEFWNIYN